MNYFPYGYNPRFAPQMAAPAFYGGVAPVAGMAPQSAPVAAGGQVSGGFAVQPVTSREEALAVIADPLVSGVLLPDLGHGVIYMKRFNTQTGTSDFGEFLFAPAQPAAQEEKAEVVTVDVFNATVEKLRAEIAAVRGGRGKREVAADE